MKIFKALTLTFVLVASMVASMPSYAGFVTGYIVGSMSSPSSSSGHASGQAPLNLYSDKHDVIVCKADNEVPTNCAYRVSTGAKDIWNNTISRSTTPEEFTRISGFKTLHKIGSVIQNNIIYISMEVSK